MSKVRISTKLPSSDLNAIKLVRSETKQSLGRIRQALAKAQPFYSADLFLNDHVLRAQEIRALLLGFSELGLELSVEELAAGLSWEDTESDVHAITPEVLLSILDGAEGDFE